MLKRKVKVDCPEVKINKACILVEQQVDQFNKMAQEVEYARHLREEAINETEKEIAEIEAHLENKKILILNAQAQNKVDSALHDRIRQFIG